MNKYELAKKITGLEGLTNEEKSALVELLRTQKKYGLVWEDKPEDIEARLTDELPVLTEVKEREIISDNADAPNHILIEGDNLEALTTLAYTHAGKVDVIYIDPPYNTGNKDFVYNDSYVDKEDGYRHSKWLSFMSKRLRIAKQLLSDKGVIFISIDDNEQAPTKLLCDELFGVDKYIGCLPRVTKKSGKAHSDDIARNHDYVLLYFSSANQEFNGISTDEKGFDNTDDYLETRGKYKLNQTLDYDSLWYNPTMDFPLEVDGKIYYPGGSEEKHIDRHNGKHNPKDWVWRWSKAKFDFGLKNGFVQIKRGRNGARIYTKTYLNASIEKNSQGNYYIDYKDRSTKMSSLTFVDNEFSNDNAKKEIGRLMDANAFDFPKPTSLIKVLLKLHIKKDPVVLDFFAGSGTTLHATMQLNSEDGGHRQCILVTNNENGICENVTYERNKRVINGYTTPKGEEVEGLKDNNLRYYRTSFISRDKTTKNMRELVRLATDMLCIRNDVYNEAPFCGKNFNKNIIRYFANGKKRMLVIYDERAIIPLVELMASQSYDGIKTMVYVFSPSSDPYTDDFEDVAERVKLCALPSAIYEAYKRVLPKRKPQYLKEALAEMEAQIAEQQAAEQGMLNFDYNEEGGEA